MTRRQKRQLKKVIDIIGMFFGALSVVAFPYLMFIIMLEVCAI